MGLRDIVSDLMRIAGTVILVHDAGDIGKIDRPHHWQLGVALMAIPTLYDAYKRWREGDTDEV